MSETPQSRRKKLFALVEATITPTVRTREDAERLAKAFLSRRGLIPVEETVIGSNSGTFGAKTWYARIKVTYKVHGGWRSDFVRKVTLDAQELSIEILALDVEAIRTEIPNECPRKECVPCMIARGERPPDFYINDKPAEGPGLYDQQDMQLSLDLPEESGGLLNRFFRR